MALLLLVAACCLVAPSAAAWAADGEVDLGISMGAAVSAPGADADTGREASGSVDLGIALGAARPDRADSWDNDIDDGNNEIDLGIVVGADVRCDVRFVGVYYDEYDRVDESRARETLGEVQSVARGGHATAPGGLERWYEQGGQRVEYWADGFYTLDPAVHPEATAADLSDIPIEADTVFYVKWRKGYVVRLDANNGTDAEAAAKFAGSVAAPGAASVQRDPAFDEAAPDADGPLPEGTDEPAGAAFKDLPKATRPGYAFKGWYWADADAEPDSYGRVALKEKNADGTDAAVVTAEQAASSTGELSYRFLRQHNGGTLYAKWEIEPGAKVKLASAKGKDGADVSLWWWPERGYALSRPDGDGWEAGHDVFSADSLGGAGSVEIPLDVKEKPVPAEKLFRGWGKTGESADAGTGEVLDGRLFVSYERRGDAATGTDAYALTEAAYGYWEGVNLDAIRDADDYGWRLATFDVVGRTVTISVAAPFRVVFDQGEGVPYAPADLAADAPSEGGWIASRPQRFANKTGRDVYVSGLECVDAGASSLFSGARDGLKVFSLHERAGDKAEGALVAASRMLFGCVAGSDTAGADWAAGRDACIVLKGDAEAADGVARDLFFGLDIANAGFQPSKMAVSNEGDQSTYEASLANVKYTYALVPED